MKTQKIVMILASLLISINLALAQTPSKSISPSSVDVYEIAHPPKVTLYNNSGGISTNRNFAGVQGDAYLNADWMDGMIIMKDGSVIEGKKYKYNLYTQQMQFVNNSDTVAIANPEDIKYLRIADKVFVYTDYLCQGEHKKGYFQLLEDGDCKLLKRWVALYHEKEISRDGTTCNDVFYKDCSCFLQFYDNPAQLVKSRKKDFIASLASNNQKVKDFMHEERLKIKNEKDLKRIITYYNSLIL